MVDEENKRLTLQVRWSKGCMRKFEVSNARPDVFEQIKLLLYCCTSHFYPVPRGPPLAAKKTGLESVNVTECSLKTTEGLEGLTGLTALNLSSNHLQSLEGVRGMTSLRKLWANDNRITAVRWRRITSPGGTFVQRAVPGLKRTTKTVFTVVFFSYFSSSFTTGTIETIRTVALQ